MTPATSQGGFQTRPGAVGGHLIAGLARRVLACLPALLVWATPVLSAQEPGPVPAGTERVVELIVHGNHTTPDAEILKLAGFEVGQPFDDDLVPAVTDRLRESGRFNRVEVRKRFHSIADASAIVVVIVVEEAAGISIDVPVPGPIGRFWANRMMLPIVRFEDGYGFSYGARVSIVEPFGKGSRLSVPLTWGGERRAAVEVEQTFTRGPVTRLLATGGVWQRENPAFEIADRRQQAGLTVERALAPWARVAAGVAIADVRFGTIDDRVSTAGVEAVVDTRMDRAFPRNAVHVSAAWERVAFDRAPATGRVRIDASGYLGLIGQSVLAVRGQHHRAATALPPYEQSLIGGAASLRGYRAGHRAGDKLSALSVELRLPLTSPLNLGEAGVAIFADTGAVYGARTAVRDARFDTGIGAGLFVNATVFSLRLDVARGLGGSTRAHVGLGVTF